MATETEREQQLDAILADYLDALAAGAAPDRADLLARHADLADELTAFFNDQDRFDGVMAPLRVVSPTSTISSPGGATTIATEPLASGAAFGDYEILDVIARSGMGVVYRARQKSLNRVVALKMIRAGRWATADDRQRFRLECEAAANLDHANIVPIYEVGEWRSDDLGEAVPFFSMKLIEGGSLKERLAGQPMPPRDAARLVAVIARAVDYAHQRGILHRDLKPANILLSFSRERSASAGQPALAERSRLNEEIPFLTDFGLAKWAQRDHDLTPSGIAIGTPAYIAPEQAFPARTGAPPTGLTTRVDIYGLGAVLYEVLTGRPPFKAATVLDTLLEVLEKSPIRPRDLVPTIHRDLETIALKCLEKDPTRRYASATAVADDLERFLRGEPISARPTGTLERTWLWAKRQPVVAALLAALVLTGVAGGTSVTWQWRRAEANLDDARTQKTKAEELAAEKETQRKVAEDQKERAEKEHAELAHEFQQVNVALSELCQRAVSAPSEPATTAALKRSILNAAVPNYEDLLKRKGRDIPIESNLALTYWHLGHLAANAKQPNEAIRRFEQSLALYQQLAKDRPNKAQHRENVARTYLRLADLRDKKGDREQAAQDYATGIELLEPFARTEPPTAEFLRLQAGACRSLGHIHFDAKRWDEAEQWFARGAQIARVLVKLDGHSGADQARLADNLLDVAHCRHGAGKPAEARPIYQEAVDAFRPLLTPTGQLGWHINADNALKNLAKTGPGRAALLPEIAASHRRVGDAHLRVGQPADALWRFGEARQAADEWFKASPDSPEARAELARCYHDLATVHDRLGEVEPAVRALERARGLRQPLVARDPIPHDLRTEIGLTLTLLGRSYAELGREDDARAALTDAAEQYRLALNGAPPTSPVRGHLGANLAVRAEFERKAGRLTAAATALTERRKLLADQSQELYATAREFSLLALRAGQGKSMPSPDEAEAKRRYSGLAVDTLKDALAKGFTDVDQMKKEPAFAVLRNRPEFNALFKK